MNESQQNDTTSNGEVWSADDSRHPLGLTDTPVGPLTPSTLAPPSRRQIRAPKTWNILSIVSSLLGLTASPLSLPFGLIALRQIRLADQRGEMFAWSAIALGWLWLWVWAVGLTSLAVIWQQRALSLDVFTGNF